MKIKKKRIRKVRIKGTNSLSPLLLGFEVLEENLNVATPEYIGVSILCYISSKMLKEILAQELFLNKNLIKHLDLNEKIFVPTNNKIINKLKSKIGLRFIQLISAEIDYKVIKFCNQYNLTLGEVISLKLYYRNKLKILVKILETPLKIITFSTIYFVYITIIFSPISLVITKIKMNIFIYLVLFSLKLIIFFVTSITSNKIITRFTN